MAFCRYLKVHCLSSEAARSTFALLGVGLLMASVWVAIEYQVPIREWIAHNVLLHGLLFGAATLTDVLLIFGTLCLGFSECSEAERRCRHAYRGRRSSLFPEAMSWLDGVGCNPRRRPGTR
jgi:hypothetical protein